MARKKNAWKGNLNFSLTALSLGPLPLCAFSVAKYYAMLQNFSQFLLVPATY